MLAAIEWNSLIVAPVSEMLTKLIGYLPTLIGALIILTVGWVLAKTLKKVVTKALEAVHFSKLADRAGISEILNKGGLKISANDVLSGLVGNHNYCPRRLGLYTSVVPVRAFVGLVYLVHMVFLVLVFPSCQAYLYKYVLRLLVHSYL